MKAFIHLLVIFSCHHLCKFIIIRIHRVLIGKSEEEKPLGRPRIRWENNINHDLREVDYIGDDWKTLAEDREVWRAYVHAVMNLRVRWCQ